MKRLLIFALAGGLLGTSLTACIQVPTESRSVVDLRPTLSFTVEAADSALLTARVLVDGLDMGRVGDYLTGRQLLRVLPGNHLVSIELDGRILLQERVYLGDGTSRSIVVK